MNITDLKSLLEYNQRAILFQTIAGSHAYGTAHGKSDQDIRGVFILPSREYLSLGEPVSMVADERHDTVYYSLRRLLQLATTANPNIIELLFMPQECIQICTPFMQRVIDQRQLFITQRVYDSHIGYAQAQLKKARGQNKWVNKPQPDTAPKKIDYCWVVLYDSNSNSYPCRPVPLQQTSIDLTHCHASSLEHASNIYRLYHIGASAQGVFKNDNIVCQSIAKQEELTAFVGLLIFNKQGYACALRDYHNYWQWRENRNEYRWLSQERGYLDYDAKNMLHMFRLLLSGENILRHGFPIVRFDGNDLRFLMRILSGEFEYNELIDLATKKLEQIAALKSKSTLPVDADMDKINHLLYDITAAWEKIIAK